MTVFDRRHRWGPVIREGARITRICRACGRSDTAETIVPDVFIEAVFRAATKKNPYRALVR